MIIKGQSRAGPSALAAHLGNAEKNERVSLLETRGTVAQDLRGALIEMDAYAAGTRCQKSLYHAAISPEPPHRLTPEQRNEAIGALEDKLGLTGHARVVVMHEKLGREHIHVVWSRIDLDRLTSVSDSHNYRKHEEVARDLERRFGHARVQGAHAERDGPDGEKMLRPDRTPSRAELRQEERTGIRGRDVKEEVTALFRASDGAGAFKSALEENGYILAKGDKRDFVLVDRAGGIHSLARRIDGIRAAQLREFMSPIDRESLPEAARAKEMAEERERKRREAQKDARTQADYSRGADYASQTQAALKDHARRQQRLDDEGLRSRRPEQPTGNDRGEENAERDRQRRAQEEATRQAQQAYQAEKSGRKSDGVEMTDAQRARFERLLKAEKADRDKERGDRDPDRPREAPGGGRTRSR
jgi:Relaxase/Mobilisation nuclease domain